MECASLSLSLSLSLPSFFLSHLLSLSSFSLFLLSLSFHFKTMKTEIHYGHDTNERKLHTRAMRLFAQEQKVHSTSPQWWILTAILFTPVLALPSRQSISVMLCILMILAVPLYHVACNMTCCTWWALNVLHVNCTQLCPGHFSIRL